MNVPLCLLRLIEEMALPLTVYAGVRKLATLLRVKWSHSSSPSAHRNARVTAPEYTLAGLVTIVVKLFYPFDGLPRYPASLGDAACISMDWDVWAAETENRERKQ